jgi:hypothetical protein
MESALDTRLITTGIATELPLIYRRFQLNQQSESAASTCTGTRSLFTEIRKPESWVMSQVHNYSGDLIGLLRRLVSDVAGIECGETPSSSTTVLDRV